jgi:hypothetical protein
MAIRELTPSWGSRNSPACDVDRVTWNPHRDLYENVSRSLPVQERVRISRPRYSYPSDLEFRFLFLKLLHIHTRCPMHEINTNFGHITHRNTAHSLSLVDTLKVNTFPETDSTRHRSGLAQIHHLIQLHQLRTCAIPCAGSELFRE